MKGNLVVDFGDDRLKRRLQKDDILVVPAAFDMVSAKIIEKEGFGAVTLSGLGQSAFHLGLPDAGLMTFSGFENAVNRGKIYEKAGADEIFAESPHKLGEETEKDRIA